MANLLQTIVNSIYSDYVMNQSLSKGDRLPTVRELRKRYNTSGTTIVHALSVLEEQGVIEKRHGVGCYIADGPRQEFHASYRMLGLIVQNESSELPMRVYRGVESIRQRFDYNVMIADGSDSYDAERAEVQRMINSGCQAIILYPALRTPEQLANDYLKTDFKDFPIVLVDLAFREQGRSQIMFDNYRAGYEMTEMLLNDGHQHVAFALCNSTNSHLIVKSNAERHRGYMDALRMARVEARPEDEWLIEGFDAGNDVLIDLLMKWKETKDRPTALVALEDKMATNVTHIAKELGVSIPDELEVVGFDNLVYGQSCRPSFPTTDPDFVRAGALAVEIALEHISGHLKEPITYMLPAPIVLRTGRISPRIRDEQLVN